MLKKVRVKIVTDRTEMKGSLFEGGVVENKAAESTHLEMTVQARYYDDGERVNIGYTESEASGMEGSKTTITYQKSAPGLVSILRTGSVKTALVFEKGRRHHCVYQTPIMPFEVSVHTTEVKNDLEARGTLYLDYAVELRGAQAERTKMTLSLLPDFDTP